METNSRILAVNGEVNKSANRRLHHRERPVAEPNVDYGRAKPARPPRLAVVSTLQMVRVDSETVRTADEDLVALGCDAGPPDATALYRRVIAAYEAIGYPQSVVGSWAISENDVADLVTGAIAARPSKILEVGTYVGVSTMLLALACPQARIVTVDPDLPLRVEMTAAGSIIDGMDADATTTEVARRAAAELGVLDRIRFVRGGFSVGETFSSLLSGGGAQVGVVGPELCNAEGPFDFAFIDGLHSAQAVRADLELAAGALRPKAPIVLHDCVGFWGANVRSGVFEFLRARPDYFFSHPQYARIYRSVGVLRRAPDRRGLSGLARPPFRRVDVSPAVTQAMTRVAADMVGDRPLIELTFGVGLLVDHWEGRGYGLQRLARRGSSADEVIQELTAALEHTDGCGIFSAELLDFAPGPLLVQVLKLALGRGCPLVLTSTPPGEEGVSGPFSRPIAAVIDLVEKAGGAVYAHPALDLESDRYPLLPEPRALGGDSKFTTVVVAAPPGGFTDALGRSLTRLQPQAASEREQLELQRVHLVSAYRRYFRDCGELSDSNGKAGERILKLEADLRQQWEQLNQARSDLDSAQAQQAAGAAEARELAARFADLAKSLRDLELEKAQLRQAIAKLEQVNADQQTSFRATEAELDEQLRAAEARHAQFKADQDAQHAAAEAERAQLLQQLGGERERRLSLTHIAIEAFDTVDVLEVQMERQDEAMRAAGIAADLSIIRLGHENEGDSLDAAVIAFELAQMRQNARLVTASAVAAAAKIGELESERDELRRAFDQVTASTSWRVTGPIRMARRGLASLARAPANLRRRLVAAARGRRLVALQERLNAEVLPLGVEVPVFDAEWYARQYGDVRAETALRHYLMFGEAEGRWPHEKFDPGFYRDQYPDVAASRASPLLHFLAHGVHEGRTPCGALYPLNERASATGNSPLAYYASV